MNDELKKLKNAFDHEQPVKPDVSAKKAAMNAAMQAFSKENDQSHQGNLVDNRLKGQGNTKSQKLIDYLTFSKWRNSMKLSYFLAGSASVAVLTLAVLNSGQFQEIIAPTKPDSTNDIAVINPSKIKKEKPAESPKSKTFNQAELSDKISAPSPAQPTVPLGNLQAESKAASSFRKPTTMRKRAARSDQRHQKITSRAMPATEPIVNPGFVVQGHDKFSDVPGNPTRLVAKDPVSTFSIDVDTASYSFMRAAINRNVLPPKASVRVEEMINYFPYDYTAPDSNETPFKTSITISPTPWNTETRLIHIGIKGYELKPKNKPRSNLVFLLDTSGSMNAPNKLPLLKNAFKLLLSTLSQDDTVSIVTYAGSAGVVLAPTRVKNKAKILASLDKLRAGGSTAGGEGIRLAYQLAKANFNKKGVNRVMLATDGDFNVGIRSTSELKSFIERKRKTGIFLSVLGFGMGNYNDALMQSLAQNGNGNAAYIDSLSEARKVLVQEASSTLFTIAKDVKIQMEFNPQTVSEYRLIGYETRKLKREDFNNDKVDAGDIGAGHTVTAIYEITPSNAKSKLIDKLRYKKSDEVAGKPVSDQAGEYGFMKLRYKLPNENKSRLISTPVKIVDSLQKFTDASQDVRFATAVAAFGQLLRGGKYLGDYNYDKIIKLAQQAKGDDRFGYRSEFINLVRLAKSAASLQPQR